MIRQYLVSLFINFKIFDLVLITIMYIINYLVTFRFAIVISNSDFNIKNFILTSVFMGIFGILVKPFAAEWLFGLTNSILIIFILVYYFKPIDLKSLWNSIKKSVWTWIVINLLIAICLGLLLKPLLLIIPKEFYCSTFGIVIGTIFEFSPMLILLIFINKRPGR